jgi:hypothetical protein
MAAEAWKHAVANACYGLQGQAREKPSVKCTDMPSHGLQESKNVEAVLGTHGCGRELREPIFHHRYDI